jgi:hypothetical protein
MPREEVAMPREEVYEFSDEKLLVTMRASVNDVRSTLRRTQALIEQTRITLREFDDRWPPIGGRQPPCDRSIDPSTFHFINSFEAVPNDRDLIAAVMDRDGLHTLDFPCRFDDGIWSDAKTGRMIEIDPTHWRYWKS